MIRIQAKKQMLAFTVSAFFITMLIIQVQFIGAVTYAYASFNFDSASPALIEGQSTPLAQTSSGVTASFSSPSDPAAFSIQSYSTTFLKLSDFSGKYLYDNNPTRDILDLKFNAQLISISFTFATVEMHGGPSSQPSLLSLVAYLNQTLVGSTSAGGTFSNNTYPQGTMNFTSVAPFDWVRVTLPPQASGATDFLVDNLYVTTVSSSVTPTPTPTVSPTPTVTPSSTPTPTSSGTGSVPPSSSPPPTTSQSPTESPSTSSSLPPTSTTPNPSDSSTPLPTSSTPTQSAIPTQSTSSTSVSSSPSDSISASPSIPEFPTLIVLPLILFVAMFFVILKRKSLSKP